MSKLCKSWLCNVQVGQHMVEWWKNLLPDAVPCTAAGSWFSCHSTTCWPTCTLHSQLLNSLDGFFLHNFVHKFGIMARKKQTARKNTGGGATLNSKFILYHTLFTCKYLYWLPVGLVINICTCLYTLFVFLEGRKTKNGTKQPCIPIPSLVLRKGGGGGGRGGGKYLCACFCENQPKLYVFFIFWP